jgi:hypothetical protein
LALLWQGFSFFGRPYPATGRTVPRQSLISFYAVVAREHAHWRFVIAEVADALPGENPAKKELLTLIAKEG